jgi:hypothetical protein
MRLKRAQFNWIRSSALYPIRLTYEAVKYVSKKIEKKNKIENEVV